MSLPMVDRDTLKALLGMPLNTFVTKYAIQPNHIRTNVSYEALRGVTAIHNPSLSPAHFYFRDDQLILIYMGNQAALSSLNQQQLFGQLGGRGTELPSRAGKTSNLHLYSRQGFAMSVGDGVDFYELFSPLSDAEYQKNIYAPSEPFRK